MNRLTVVGEAKAELTVERSRFLAWAAGVADEAQAIEFIAAASKKFYDATHNCYAFSAGQVKRFSDDGEPSGTAGRPILNVIEQKGLENTVVVVTRYFGGVKLGAGGLVRAYSNAAAAALDRAEQAEITRAREISLSVPFSLFRQTERLCDRYALEKKTLFSTEAEINLLVGEEKAEAFLTELASLDYRISAKKGGQRDFLKALKKGDISK